MNSSAFAALHNSSTSAFDGTFMAPVSIETKTKVQALLLARDPVALAGTLGFGPHAALLGIVSAWDGVLGAERELQITVAASTLKKASIHACHLANGDLIFMNRIGHGIWMDMAFAMHPIYVL